jgi:hypothetical protein
MGKHRRVWVVEEGDGRPVSPREKGVSPGRDWLVQGGLKGQVAPEGTGSANFSKTGTRPCWRGSRKLLHHPTGGGIDLAIAENHGKTPFDYYIVSRRRSAA